MVTACGNNSSVTVLAKRSSVYSCYNTPQYKKIFTEFSVANDIKILTSRIYRGLAHKDHAGFKKTLNLLRETYWFPDMSQMIQENIEICWPCNVVCLGKAAQVDFKGSIDSKC